MPVNGNVLQFTKNFGSLQDMKTLLCKYLDAEKLTFTDFADRIGRNPSTVWRWKVGRGKPDISSAILVERATAGKVPISAWAA